MASPVRSRALSSSTWPSEHEHDDDGGRLEVDADRAAVPAELGREGPRRERGDETVESRPPTPIEISVHMLRAGFSSECQPRSKNGQPDHSTTGVASTSSSHCASRGPSPARDRQADVSAHGQDEERTVSAPPTFSPGVKSTSSGFGAGVAHGRAHRLERHAADRAAAGALLHDLGVHGAGVERALARGGGFCGGRASRLAGRDSASGSAANLVRQPAEQK